jgi:hypothetical protein
MPDVSRAEHIRWCKRRALAYLDHSPGEAVTSMLSDLNKHPETVALTDTMGMIGIYSAQSAGEARRFIEGFAE